MRNLTSVQAMTCSLPSFLLSTLFCFSFSYTVFAENPSERDNLELFTISNPEAICTELAVFDLPESGLLFIKASDFDMGSFDNLTNQEDLKFSFSMDMAETDMVLDCDHLGLFDLEVYVFDGDGLFDNCSVSIELENPFGVNCDGLNVNLSGTVATEYGAEIDGVNLYISSIMQSVNTDMEGNYAFATPMGSSGTIAPTFDNDVLEGVSTYDIVRITQHILGIDFLDSPYKIIAADVNNSASVTTLDIIMLRMVILNMSVNFFNNTSWRFVDAEYEFANPMQPWDFPELIQYTNVNGDISDVNFIAIKVGDVTENAGFTSVEDRFAGTELPLTAQVFDKGNGLKECVFEASEQFLSCQFTLDFEVDDIEIIEIREGIFMDRNISEEQLSTGNILFSWNLEEKEQAEKLQGHLFTVLYREAAFRPEYDPFTISSTFVQEEFIGLDEEFKMVQLEYIEEGESFSPQLHEIIISPNPARKNSIISFESSANKLARLLIVDHLGRVVSEEDIEVVIGRNSIDLDLGLIKGLYYCQLSLGDRVFSLPGIKL